jgi:hypothetical protein
MAATDYKIVEGALGGLYLAHKTKGSTMSDVRRPITESEIIGCFEHYLREWCNEHEGDDTLFIRGDNDKLIFKATLLSKEKGK